MKYPYEDFQFLNNLSCLFPLHSVSVKRCGKCESKFLYRVEFECIQHHLPKVKNS